MMQAFKADIEYKKEEVTLSSQFVAELMDQINETRKTFDSELQKAVSVTFPAFDATRTSSIDLLAAIIETALTKISLTRARAERALYNHQPRDTGAFDQGVNVAKTIEAAYFSLKKEEKEMRVQSQSLDRQLREYESLMQLVDGGRNGYQQIINDWAKVQQETDECLKDLRRLGWTGD
ncbi:hypothetical protein BDN70DRAFT_270259 [Pholiota conissans]|uniref:Uncharacterized protein n=1 Tax=Pholiota conissans TaxID=109636 RepID=A0A9P6CWH1_9AGAR|nr:hypothetical protein BDN70DRAFT_270259 [Pholiota conissans]